MKTVDFSEIIATCHLKVGRCRQLMKFLKVIEYSKSMSFLDLGPGPITYENSNMLFSKITKPF